MSRVDAFLELAVKQGGSDVHLVSGRTPRIRLNGDLHPVRFRELTVEDVEGIVAEFMPECYRPILETNRSVDFGYEVRGVGRFRANVYEHARGLGAALRVIPDRVPTFESTGLPAVVAQSLDAGSGLFLVTGQTGSGKSTSLAAMVHHLNTTMRGHIITLEEPIEFIHTPAQCSITQREIGQHAPTFADGLRSALREDPDVLLVGEMRDAETIALALTAAETGVQILSTMHTCGAARAVDRFVNAFPPRRHDQVRAMLADSLAIIVSQQLVRTADGRGRRLAAEVLVNNSAAASMIRCGQAHKLASVIQAGARAGMQTLEGELRRMVQQGAISAEELGRLIPERQTFDRPMSRGEAA